MPLFEKEGRRDEQPPVYRENGAVVAMRRGVLEAGSRFGEKVGYVVLDKRAGFTVHDLDDFWMAERLLNQPRVLFRVDGGSRMGMGHIYRSLAIAEALRSLSRAEVAFLMSGGPEYEQGLIAVSGAGYPLRVVRDGRQSTPMSSTLALRAPVPLRMRVSRSAIGSVIDIGVTSSPSSGRESAPCARGRAGRGGTCGSARIERARRGRRADSGCTPAP